MSESEQATAQTSPWSRVALGASAVGFAAGLCAASTGPLYRLGLLDLGSTFGLLRIGAFIGGAGLLLSVVGAIHARPSTGRRGFVVVMASCLVAAMALALPLRMRAQAEAVPYIHDITTDTQNPPTFVALVDDRANSPNGTEYGGPEVAAKQRKAYPDIQPVILNAPPDDTFARAVEAADSLGWVIASKDPENGRLEATDTTFFFGFKDDIVVRVRAAEEGSRVDVRSVSRVGQSDLGKNAARIQSFVRRLKDSS